jgi:transcriptional regulator with XRE-family HTH domain
MPNPVEIDPEESPHHRFSYEMRRHRLLAGWTQERLAKRVQMSPSKIGNVETTYRHADEHLAKALDEIFGLDGHFLSLWQDTRPQAPEHYRDFADAEQKADEVHSWNPLLIPGLFQTEAYARRIFEGAPAITPDEVEHRVRNRMRRQSLLSSQRGAMVLSLIDESILRRPMGDREMMREQLSHLLEIASHRRITVQVIPLAALSTTGLQGAFEIVIVRGSACMIYAESMPEGRISGDRTVITELLQCFNLIRASALPAHESIVKIKEVMDEWT